MAKILNFDEFLSKKEMAKVIEFANRELSAPVKLDDRRPSPTAHDLRIRLKESEPPPKAA